MLTKVLAPPYSTPKEHSSAYFTPEHNQTPNQRSPNLRGIGLFRLQLM